MCYGRVEISSISLMTVQLLILFCDKIMHSLKDMKCMQEKLNVNEHSD